MRSKLGKTKDKLWGRETSVDRRRRNRGVHKLTRQQVEEEMGRAKEADAESNPIPEGGRYPTFEDIYPQLNNKDLSGVDLSGLDLSNANLNYADLKQANLTRTRLVMAELNNADLSNTQLDGTDLRGASMSFAKLQGADLSKALLEGDDPPLFENIGPFVLHNAEYNDRTQWPTGFNPEHFGAIHVGG